LQRPTRLQSCFRYQRTYIRAVCLLQYLLGFHNIIHFLCRRKGFGINQQRLCISNFDRFNGLQQALAVTRGGGDDPMFDRMFRGLNFGTTAAPLVVGTNITGSEALRRNATFRTNLANGDFRAVASSLNTSNIGVNVPAGQTIAPDSPLIYDTRTMIAQLGETMRSLQLLLELIDRDPGVLLRGRATTNGGNQ